MTPTGSTTGSRLAPGAAGGRDMRWDGRAVRVTSPVPDEVWARVAGADPAAMPFHTPAWRDCVCAGGAWQDASRLYELPGGRLLVLPLARRAGRPARLAVAASWPAGWGCGGVLAPGGPQPGEVALVCDDLARSAELSVAVRPSFAAAAVWPGPGAAALTIPRAVHVAHFREPFDVYWAANVTRKRRSLVTAARRHLEAAGVVITTGHSPGLVQAFYDVYLRWISQRAAQQRLPAPLARWHGRRAEPLAKFAAVATRLGEGCRIQVAWWDGRPIGANITLEAGRSAVGWRSFADRSAPARFRLTEILTVESMRHACDSGCRYLEMGESGARAELAGVKTRFGGQQHAFHEYRFERAAVARASQAVRGRRSRLENWLTTRGGRAAGTPGTP